MDVKNTIIEIQALHFCIDDYLNMLANLSVGYEKNEAGATFELAHETARCSGHMSILSGMLYKKISELEEYVKKEPTSSTNEVRH
ncbi:hypothetical protein [Enterococcus sp. DIV1420a]|uniref:hypothetical protein n=1 Tax=Enterococcus sp. DIV1420a TaxID=2774672 RepID=UPI003F274440